MKQRSKSSVLLAPVVALAMAVGACATEPAERGRGKPSAPVRVALETRDLGGGVHEVRLTAVPTEDVSGLELRILPKDGVTAAADALETSFPATRAGRQRTIVGRVRLVDAGGDVAGDVRVDRDGSIRSRAIQRRLGAARPIAAPPPTRIVTLPDGAGQVAEVRP
jgi:hypothetical protein